jgi:transposase InsO family protein
MFTIADITLAARKFSGLPRTERSWRNRAIKEKWEKNDDCFPARFKVSTELANLLCLSSDPVNNPVESIEVETSVRKTVRFRNYQNRAILLGYFWEFEEQFPTLNLNQAAEQFCAEYNSGRIKSAVRDTIPSISPRTLRNWRIKLSEDPKLLNNKKPVVKPRFPQEIQDRVIGMMHFRPSQILRHLKAEFPGISLPCEQSIRRWIAKFRKKNPALYERIVKGITSFKNKFRPAHGKADENITYPNQVWQLDDTRVDVLSENRTRYTVLCAIDVYTRRKKYLLSETANSEAVATLLRECIKDWGIPEEVKVDNGKNYISLATQAILTSLKIKLNRCNFRSPWQKPFVERAIGDLARYCEILPGFIGHNVIERRQVDETNVRYETRTSLSRLELQQSIDWWSATEDDRPRDYFNSQTPNERWREGIAKHPTTRVKDDRILDLLLAVPAGRDGKRIIQKKGIQYSPKGVAAIGSELNTYWYIHPILADEKYIGQQVDIRLDKDLGIIHVFLEDEYLCTASNPELTGIDRKAAAAAAHEIARKSRKAHKAVVKSIRTARKKMQEVKDAHQPSNVVSVDFNSVELESRDSQRAKEAIEYAQKAAIADTPFSHQEPGRIEKESMFSAFKKESQQRQADEAQYQLYVFGEDTLTAEQIAWCQWFEATDRGKQIVETGGGRAAVGHLYSPLSNWKS